MSEFECYRCEHGLSDILYRVPNMECSGEFDGYILCLSIYHSSIFRQKYGFVDGFAENGERLSRWMHQS